ncbi:MULTISPECIES: GntR family transcriptional regulator [Mesorhizobium]|uniref:GntR family transcriptional regulator n=1 Tax=Mesorhizobium qingshengii TaxID=1165689 RepID=A0A1G5ZWP9_9HYPH|nr:MULTISPECIES: GntR family transcriptional regulator [Mesorhizobium]MCH4560645.1 GntR family transcriptional regulator [Mesorhizobium jarvisii]SDA99082.1 GntR family transcriptional regulator [Mesorhizobium qingshengii]
MPSDGLLGMAKDIWRGEAPVSGLPSRIAVSLREKVEAGSLPAGFKFPAEATLAKQIGVSRPTLREAIRILAEERVLEVRHGVGTFVAAPAVRPLRDPLETQQSLSALLRAAGMVPSSRDLSIELVSAPSSICTELGVNEGRPIARVSRTRLADGVPLAVNYEYLVRGTPETDLSLLSLFDGSSLYSFLAEKIDLTLVQSRVIIGAVAANADHAQRLRLRKGSPLLLMRQTQFDLAGKPVLYTMSYQNSQIIEFTSIRFGCRYDR